MSASSTGWPRLVRSVERLRDRVRRRARGPPTAASGTKHAPSANSLGEPRARPRARAASCRCPPAPVSVSRRTPRSQEQRRAPARARGARPTNERQRARAARVAAAAPREVERGIVREDPALRAPGAPRPARARAPRRASRAPAGTPSSASAWRPARYSASISCAARRSRSGCSRTAAASSPDDVGVPAVGELALEPSLPPRPGAAPRAARSRPARTSSKARSSSGGPRQSASASS